MMYMGTPRDYEFYVAVRVMLRSLIRLRVNADLVVIASKDVPQQWIRQSDGVIVKPVDNIENPYRNQPGFNKRFTLTLNKLYAWTLVEYDRIVMLDADNLFLQNADELFQCGQFCAAFINPSIFHTGLFVLQVVEAKVRENDAEQSYGHGMGRIEKNGVVCTQSASFKVTYASSMRRRIYHGDVGGKAFEYLESTGHEGLNEPLINSDNCGSSERFLDDHDEEDDWREKRRKEELAWTNIFSRLIAQWAQWFATIVLGSGTWLGVFLHRTLVNYQGDSERVVTLDLSPRQEERLQKLQRRLEVPFDGTRVDHQDALRDLWRAVFPECELIGLISEQWKEMGWQGTDPSTDFRGGGLISLENLIFYAKNYPKSFQRLLHKQEGKRATWEYPFAVAGINISFMLIQMLDLRSAKPSSLVGRQFLKILAEDEMAFDMLYCVAFELLDAQWLAKRASYMEFNEVLKATQVQLERELSLEDVSCVQDLPAYNLLIQ